MEKPAEQHVAAGQQYVHSIENKASCITLRSEFLLHYFVVND